jgi:hypothetical protein
VAVAIRDLIQRLSRANVLWGAPRIHGELRKLGIDVAPSTVGKYLRQNRRPPSQSWRPFLKNHMKQMASMDFFTVPTALFRVLFVFVVLSHDRRRVVHFNVTETRDRRMDRTADSRSVSVGRSAPVLDPRSRCNLRKRSYRSRERHGHKGSGHGGAIALAKSIRGAANRIHSPGVPGPRDCVEREVVAADPPKLLSLLRQIAHTFSLGQRCAGAESCPQAGERSYCRNSCGGRTSSSIRTTCRLTGLLRNVLPPMFGLFAWGQLRPEVSGQREFSMIQGRRLSDHEFHRLDVLIDLAD